ELVRFVARDEADLLPLRLERDYFLDRAAHVVAVGDRLGLGAQLFLASDVLLVRRFALGEGGGTRFVEDLLRAAESLPERIVVFTAGGAERFPLLHQTAHRLAGGAPIGGAGNLFGLD